MITDYQKAQITEQVRVFKDKVAEYCVTSEKLDTIKEDIEAKIDELSNVTKEERQIETAIDVLYRQTKKVSKAKDLEMNIDNYTTLAKDYTDRLNRIETELLSLLRNLPIPVNLQEPSIQNSQVVFRYFEGTELGEEAIAVISALIKKQPLAFDEITILSEKITVDKATDKQEAIQKLVEAIQNFRTLVADFSRSYEKIDELVERLVKSKVFSKVLTTLAKKKKLTVQEISKNINLDERTVYDGCYNLTRSNWSPNPIRKTPSGEWELTLTGEILVKRLREKYPQIEDEEAQNESVK
jgi:hypothetical protein